jgi:hypothetical protein
LHHFATYQNDPDSVVPVCLNCHRKVTEGLMQAGISMKQERNPTIRVALMLNALVVFLDMLGVSVGRWARILKDSVTKEGSNE